eukprot:7209441-Alexandrium_andersonii.AAC.1
MPPATTRPKRSSVASWSAAGRASCRKPIGARPQPPFGKSVSLSTVWSHRSHRPICPQMGGGKVAR